MQGDLISRSALIEKLNKQADKNLSIEVLEKLINEQPTAFHLGMAEERFMGYADIAGRRLMGSRRSEYMTEYQCWNKALRVLEEASEC